MQVLSHYNDTKITAGQQRQLRVVQRQVMKSLETNQTIEAHIMRFFLFDEKKSRFNLQYSSIYDISDSILNPMTNSFTN